MVIRGCILRLYTIFVGLEYGLGLQGKKAGAFISKTVVRSSLALTYWAVEFSKAKTTKGYLFSFTLFCHK